MKGVVEPCKEEEGKGGGGTVMGRRATYLRSIISFTSHKKEAKSQETKSEESHKGRNKQTKKQSHREHIKEETRNRFVILTSC